MVPLGLFQDIRLEFCNQHSVLLVYIEKVSGGLYPGSRVMSLGVHLGQNFTLNPAERFLPGENRSLRGFHNISMRPGGEEGMYRSQCGFLWLRCHHLLPQSRAHSRASVSTGRL